MSLTKRLHEVRTPTGGPSRRDPVLDELRQKIHHHLIDELGPLLYDRRLSEDDLRVRVQDQLQKALQKENHEVEDALKQVAEEAAEAELQAVADRARDVADKEMHHSAEELRSVPKQKTPDELMSRVTRVIGKSSGRPPMLRSRNGRRRLARGYSRCSGNTPTA